MAGVVEKMCQKMWYLTGRIARKQSHFEAHIWDIVKGRRA